MTTTTTITLDQAVEAYFRDELTATSAELLAAAANDSAQRADLSRLLREQTLLGSCLQTLHTSQQPESRRTNQALRPWWPSLGLSLLSAAAVIIAIVMMPSEAPNTDHSVTPSHHFALKVQGATQPDHQTMRLRASHQTKTILATSGRVVTIQVED